MCIKLESGIFRHCDNTYDIVGFKEKTQTVIIEKVFQRSIFYGDITKSIIKRKLSKQKTIKIDNIKYDLSDITGL